MESSPNKKHLLQNWFSVAGAISAVVCFSVILCLIILDIISKGANPYLIGFTYLILPLFLIFSIFLILFGAWRERKRREKHGHVKKFPHIDFNDPSHQKWAFIIIAIATLFLFFSTYGAYRAYEFTESVQFCGKVCHQVMNPEFTAHSFSPHAHVSCTECHVGSGPDWYVRSKLSGLRQIYKAATHTYHQPIETPVKNLRPAQETCEHCHWPQQFYGAVELDKNYFLSDESNTEWRTKMLVFVGGGAPPFGKREGIHWHMNIKNKIYYVASDDKRQVIPWVKSISPDGKATVFVDKKSKASAEHPPKGEMRRMDCIDCHNRPTHIYRAPSEAVDEAMGSHALDSSLPYMKREAVKALTKEYDSTETARDQIRKYLETFYESHYPDAISQKKESLDKSIEAVQKIYETNFFPHMKVSWKKYPNNIGHLISTGCFRCHDGKHKSQDGRMISNDCRTCHIITSQGPVGAIESSADGLEFKHPNDEEGAWKEASCTDCHTGGPA